MMRDKLLNAAAKADVNSVKDITPSSPINEIGDVIYDYKVKYHSDENSGFVQGFAKVSILPNKVSISYLNGSAVTVNNIVINCLSDKSLWSSSNHVNGTVNGLVYVYGYSKAGVLAIGNLLANDTVLGFTEEKATHIGVYISNKELSLTSDDVEEVITITAKSGKVTIQHNILGAKRTYDLDKWTPTAMLANFIDDELVPESANFKSEVAE